MIPLYKQMKVLAKRHKGELNMETSNFQFGTPKLLSVKYKLNENFTPPETMPLNLSSSTTVKRAKDKRVAQVTLAIKVFDEEKFSESPFFIEIVMQGNFIWSEDLEPKAKKLLSSNAPAILLSYMRPYISQLTIFSGYPPLILPLLNFTNDNPVTEVVENIVQDDFE